MRKTIAVMMIFIFLVSLTSCGKERKPEEIVKSNKEFNMLITDENRDISSVISQLCKDEGIELRIDYEGTIDIMDTLNSENGYDAVWYSNSIWLYRLNNKNIIKNSKFISINPVCFGIKESIVDQLGWKNKEVYLEDIIQEVKNGKFKFLMPNPTQTNSGASAYLGFLHSLAGSPEILTSEYFTDELKEDLKSLFAGVERSSGSDEFLNDMYLSGNYDAMVNYEGSILNLNKQLQNDGKEILYLIYPKDGVSLSDSPFAYIDRGNDEKLEIFKKIQDMLLSDECQNYLDSTGRRVGYGGIKEAEGLFKKEWGAKTNEYISPIKYPSSETIIDAFALYQDVLRKPSWTMFCLDYSGSMEGKGYKQLTEAMRSILEYENASKQFIQFNERDNIGVILFNGGIKNSAITNNGKMTDEILKMIMDNKPGGGTDIYNPTLTSLEYLKNIDMDEYSVSIVLMTDGQSSNEGMFSNVKDWYTESGKNIPIFSIMFGDANDTQLKNLAELSNGLVMDGRINLVKAFKKVRGYN